MGSRHGLGRVFKAVSNVCEVAMRLLLICRRRRGSGCRGRRREVMDGLMAVGDWLRDSKHRHVGTQAC